MGSWTVPANLPADVLIVEDEAITRIVAADVVSDQGIMVWEAADADEALCLVEEQPRIRLVCTDVNMPGSMDGLALAEELYRRRPSIEVIVTSSADRLTDNDLPPHGVFLPKPYQPAQLAALVRSKLEKA